MKTPSFLMLPALALVVLLAIACGSTENVPMAPGEAIASPPDSFIKAPHKGGSASMQAATPAPMPDPTPPPPPPAPVDAGAPKDASASKDAAAPRAAAVKPATDAGKSTAVTPRDAGAAKK